MNKLEVWEESGEKTVYQTPKLDQKPGDTEKESLKLEKLKKKQQPAFKENHIQPHTQ